MKANLPVRWGVAGTVRRMLPVMCGLMGAFQPMAWGDDAADQSNGTGAWEVVQPAPLRFERHTDANGFRWGLSQDGSIGLSGRQQAESSSIPAGLPVGWALEGAPFQVESARTSPDLSEVELRGRSGKYSVTRRIWIDKERGGARYVETIAGPEEEAGAGEVTLAIELSAGEHPIHRVNGNVLTQGPPAKDSLDLGKDEALLFVAPEEEENPGVLLVFGEARNPVKPRLAPGEQGRWRLEWKLRLPENGGVSLVYWVAQRPAPAPEQARDLVAAFWKNGRLVRPRVPETTISTVVNFSPRHLGGEGEAPGAGELLAPLARLATALGIERDQEDTYWMNANSVLGGEAQGAPLTVESRFGRFEAPLDEVAAVQGGGGRGRMPRVFLRDGNVLPGQVTLPDWKIVGARGWTIQIQPDTLEALVLRERPEDGVTDGRPSVLVRLTSEEVLPLRWSEEETLSLTTPWGPLETPLGDIRAFWHLRAPAPACRLWLKDGSRLTVFPSPREVTAESARLGTLTVAVTDVAAFWQPGVDLPAADEEPEEITDFSGVEAPSACLLKGQNLVAATLDGDTLVLLTGATETRVATAEITEIQRAEDSSDAQPVFQLALAGGASFQGVLRGETVALKTSSASWQVPVAHFLAYKRTAAAQ